MSRSTTHTFTCPCGQPFSGQAYEYVNAAEDPHLRYVVLAGLINVATCPNCGRRAAISTPFVYSDPAYKILAYVHPRADAPEDARILILEKLRDVYMDASKVRDQQSNKDENNNGGRVVSLTPSEAKDMPPLKVVFGIEQLGEVIGAVLSPEDRLGRLALSTQSRNEAERGQFHDITRKLATEMGCCIEVEDQPDEYTVWVHGSRRQVGALMRELATRG
ncbi:CpXC domain-containing protein [Dictyobacter arantiisoli]|uniref:CpXC domain-containing protein n=1 Tax=Dictyobacter arantiisoli TaxID=2014874 RepID=A0A5A5T6A0_9CHLR|nr:CpXC domain-containing protein [Dictyobacter arantiisoli]GCF06534.1 hypothetical protein KDI_00980 [Dictyobacter arantiisoli]